MFKSKLRIVTLLLVVFVALAVLSGCNLLPGQTPTPTAAPTVAPTAVPTEEPTAVPNDDTQNVEETVFNYLEENVPEIAEYRDYLENNNGGTLIMRLDGTPDETSNDEFARNYQIYVGEDLGDHTSRWYSFYVNKDMDEIKVEDVVSGELISLAAWRKTL